MLSGGRKNKKFAVGFTMLELLIVIAIIGLLASIMMVSFSGAQRKARIAQGWQFSDSLRASLQADMVGWWAFNKGSGGIAQDSYFGQHHGTIYGATWVEGIVNNALSFDGNDYVNMGRPASLQISDSMTIAYWVKPTDVASGRQNSICKMYNESGCITHEPEASISFYSGNGSAYLWYSLQANMANDVWHHIAFTRDDSTQTVRGYVDGKWDGSYVIGWRPTVAGGNDWRIGRGYVNDFRGIIDEVQIYNIALPQSAIQQHYAEGLKRHQNLVKK